MNRKLLSRNALIQNAEFFKGCAPKVCAVVKADAYGHGINEVASTLEGHVDFFGVSSLGEAERLRQVCPNAKIIVLGKCFNFARLDRFYLTATTLSDVQKAIDERKTEKCFIKLCANMNRYGISCKDDNLLQKLKNLIKNHEFAGFSVHFSSISNKEATKDENAFLLRALKKLGKTYPISAGGSGAYNLPCDILRVGIGLYGYGFGPRNKVMTLEARVNQVRTLKRGERAGYDGTVVAEKPMTLALVSAGYADGFSQNKSAGLMVKIDGKSYPIVGNMCMDCCFVDVTGSNVKEGQRVTMFADASAFAKAYGQIEYEVLTSFGRYRGKTILV